MEQEGGPGPISWVGCGCGCLSGLLFIGGLMLLFAGLTGALYLDAGPLYGGVGGALCVGTVGAIVGIALYIKGHKS